MMNLVIGLCFGIASAIALIIMWRMAERLRRELQSAQDESVERETLHRDETPSEPITGR